jgi:hypothetical protein
MLAKSKNYHANIWSNFLWISYQKKNMGYLHIILWKKNVLCEKGDEITRFDGTNF